MQRLNTFLTDQKPQLTSIEVDNRLEASAAANREKKRTVSFLAAITEPPLAMGTFGLQSSYNPSKTPAGEAEVLVTLAVLGVTMIDSKKKTVGIHIALSLAWQDPRIVFKTREPEVYEEFQYSPGLLK